MRPPGADVITSSLIDVKENEAFSDETIIDQTRVVVRHKIVSSASGHNRIVYSTEITGPSAAEFGAMVTGDFQTVLKALKDLAEHP